MKPEAEAPSPQSNRGWHRRQGLRSSLVELFVTSVTVSLLLQLGTSTKAQLVIQLYEYSEPKFSISCNQLLTVRNRANRSCGSLFYVPSIDNIQLTFSGISHELCNNSKYEMELDLNKMLNYLDNTCSVVPEASDEPYRLPAQQFHDSYNRHCIPTASLPLKAVVVTLIVSCRTMRALSRLTTDDPASTPTSSGNERTTLAVPSTTIRLTTATKSMSFAATDQVTPTLWTDTKPITMFFTATIMTPSAARKIDQFIEWPIWLLFLMVFVGVGIISILMAIVLTTIRLRCPAVAERQQMTSLSEVSARHAAAELPLADPQLDGAYTSLEHQQEQQREGEQIQEYQRLDVGDTFRVADRSSPTRKKPAALALSDGSARIADAELQFAERQLDCAYTALEKEQQEQHVQRQREYERLDVGGTTMSSPTVAYYTGLNAEVDQCYDAPPHVDALSHEVRDELKNHRVHLNPPLTSDFACYTSLVKAEDRCYAALSFATDMPQPSNDHSAFCNKTNEHSSPLTLSPSQYAGASAGFAAVNFLSHGADSSRPLDFVSKRGRKPNNVTSLSDA